MGKYLLKLSDLEENMVLGEDLFNRYGNLILKKETVLTNKYIEEIKKKITDQVIYILQDVKPEKINKNSEEIKKNFKRITKLIRYSFDNLCINPNSHELVNNLNVVVKTIKKNIKMNIDVLNHLTEINEVDDYLYRHSVNVGVIAHFIGQWIKLPQDQLDKLILAGLLHDIGKLKIPEEVLHKPSKLTEEEFTIMKTHSTLSYLHLKSIGLEDEEILRAVISHHEKEDGKGYPYGLKAEEIPLFAKIITIADIFDAMISNRVYRAKELPFKVLEMLYNQSFGELNSHLVLLFVKKFSDYYIGTKVILDNNKTATIIKFNEFEVAKPLIRTEDGEFIDTSINREIKIVELIYI